jgi:hypothetical protein
MTDHLQSKSGTFCEYSKLSRTKKKYVWSNDSRSISKDLFGGTGEGSISKQDVSNLRSADRMRLAC